MSSRMGMFYVTRRVRNFSVTLSDDVTVELTVGLKMCVCVCHVMRTCYETLNTDDCLVTRSSVCG